MAIMISVAPCQSNVTAGSSDKAFNDQSLGQLKDALSWSSGFTKNDSQSESSPTPVATAKSRLFSRVESDALGNTVRKHFDRDTATVSLQVTDPRGNLIVLGVTSADGSELRHTFDALTHMVTSEYERKVDGTTSLTTYEVPSGDKISSIVLDAEGNALMTSADSGTTFLSNCRSSAKLAA